MHEQWEEKEEEAREGQNEREHGLQPLAAADEDEQRAEKDEKADDRFRAVVAVHRAGGERARLAAHGDDRHARRADRAEEQAVRAVRLGLRTVREAQAYDLVADVAAVLLQVVAQDLRDRRAFEAASLRIDELWLFDIVEMKEKGEQGDGEQGDAEPFEK